MSTVLVSAWCPATPPTLQYLEIQHGLLSADKPENEDICLRAYKHLWLVCRLKVTSLFYGSEGSESLLWNYYYQSALRMSVCFPFKLVYVYQCFRQ
jgi:hypothetical protein